MFGGHRGLNPGVKTDSGVHCSVAEQSVHDLVAIRIAVEIEPSRGMAEEMNVHLKSGSPGDLFRYLIAKKLACLGIAFLFVEQERTGFSVRRVNLPH